MDEIKTSWDFSLFFKDLTDAQIKSESENIIALAEKFANNWKTNQEYLSNSQTLKIALDEYNELLTKISNGGKLGTFFWLKNKLDLTNPEIKSRLHKIDEISIKSNLLIQFFTIRLSKISNSQQEEFLNSPELSDYKHFLRRLFENGRFTLSEGEEKIMQLKSKTSYEIWDSLIETLLSKEEREIYDENDVKISLNFEQLLKKTISQNKKVRDAAAEKVNEILETYSDIAEIEINAILSNRKENDEIRGFSRPDQKSLLRDDISPEIVDVLVNTVTEHFDISKRFYKLRAMLEGVDKLEYHERLIPYGDFNRELNFEETLKIILSAFNSLDPEFAEIASKFVEEGRVDAFPKKGKTGGAFCVYFTKKIPSFILLNHQNTLRDLETFAHELGHGINDELMRVQKEIYFSTSLATAEVASTLFEDYAMKESMKNQDEKTLLSFLVYKLSSEISSILRQVACYNFEKSLRDEFRKKGYLSKKEIGEIFNKHMFAYMGESVNNSPGCENWWIYWSHIRRYFYVYSYASGLLISKALQNLIAKDNSNVLKVKKFLSAGSSKSPKDIFSDLGIDITKKEFWEQGLAELENSLSEAENLANKLKLI